MRAVVLSKYGAPEVLEVSLGVPRPPRRPGQVLVAVVATSVNPIDCKFRSGEVPRLMSWWLKVLGRDLAGVVLEADPGSAFPPGTGVYGFTDWWQQSAYAEEVSVPEGVLATMPSQLSFEEAAALPLVATTAWQALDAAALQPGQRLLIHAGSGGVGSVAIQLAKARGLHVTTTCSTGNTQLVMGLGADEVVDYTKQRFEEAYKDLPFHGIIDVVGGDYLPRSFSVLRKDGVYVDIGNSGYIRKYGNLAAAAIWLFNTVKGQVLSRLKLGPRYHFIAVKPNGSQLAEVTSLVEEGRVRPVIGRTGTLDEISKCHSYVEEGHTKGKVVVRVRDKPPVEAGQ